MNDPKRLLEEGPTELERSLLNAALAEEPSPEHRMRVREAMGLGAGGAAAPVSGPVGSGAGKMAFLGLVVAGGIAAFLLIGRSRQASRPETPPSAPATPIAAPLPEAVVAPAAPGPTEPGTAPSLPDSPQAESLDPAAAPHAAHRAAPAPSMGSDIREQIRLIDEARSALTAHDPTSALRTLDQYRSKFPGGALEQEAAVFRIEALDQRGDHAQAASMARAFLARNPASAHAKRLERIAGQ